MSDKKVKSKCEVCKGNGVVVDYDFGTSSNPNKSCIDCDGTGIQKKKHKPGYGWGISDTVYIDEMRYW